MASKITIFNPFTNKMVKINEYGITAKKIYREYIEEAGIEPDLILPDGLIYKNGRFLRTKKQQLIDKGYKKARRWSYQKDFNTPIAQTKIQSLVKNILKNYAGQSVKIITFRDGNVFHESIQDIPTNFASWWKSSSFFRTGFMIDSAINIFAEEDNLSNPFADEGDADYGELKASDKQGILIIDPLKLVQGSLYQQNFLDGITHCFFTPIKEWAGECLEESKSKTAKKRYNGYLKKIDEYIKEYKNGVPENKLQEVCDKLQISVEVDLPAIQQENFKLLTIESNKKPLKKFKFINTRIDHLEINDLKNTNTYIEIDEHKMYKLVKRLNKEKKFYYYKCNGDSESVVYTTEGVYKLQDDYQDTIKEFTIRNKLDNYKIDHRKNKNLSEFCLDAVKTNGTIDFEKGIRGKDPENYHHIDMKRAYTKSKDCKYYRGILGKITDFRKTNKIVGIGLYLIRNVKINNDLFKKLNFIHNDNIYTNAELEYFQDNGVEFDIVMGCWGSRIDLDFGKGEDDNTGMYARVGGDGPRMYCKWFGCLTICNEFNKYRIPRTTEKFMEIMDTIMKSDDVGNFYYQEQTEWSGAYGVVEYKKRAVYHQAQIASFIVSYQRISILEQLKKIEMQNIGRVCVDGIYFKGDEVQLDRNFNYKDGKTFGNEAGTEYCINHRDKEDDYPEYLSIFNQAEFRENNQYEFHKGPGGTGKTHTNLMDKGLVDVLFVAPSWKLARRKQQDYGVDSTTFYHLLTADPEVWTKYNRKYSVFLIDEVSMLSDFNKNNLINRYRNQKFIFCGDVGFQLDPVYDPFEIKNNLIGNFRPYFYKYYYSDGIVDTIEYQGNQNTTFDNCDLIKEKIYIPIKEHNTMYRCKCPILKQNLIMLREIISKRKIDIIKPEELNQLINNKTINKDTIDYKIEDYIITNTHIKKDEYSEKFKDIKKYYVRANTRDYCNGQIIYYNKPEGVKNEIRHGYTIHSLQGETAEAKLFIDIRGIRSLKMVYTAISRAKYWKQIVFIK